MITYQDLLKVGDSDADRTAFVRRAIESHKNSEDYMLAEIAEKYFKHRNVTIEEFRKLLYTVTGQAVPDNFSANYKMANRFFYRFITQEVQYLLGNGVSWGNEQTDEKLGKNFDTMLQKAGRNALIHKVAFGFWNLDHLDVFSYLEFLPLWDEENGSMPAGIRFWQIDSNKPLRATLYELDGYTDYMWKSGEDAIITPKRSYVAKTRTTIADGTEIYDWENYPTFPIVPLWANHEHQSEFVGLREQIDCYDLIKSGFANTVDEASIVYWTLQNAGGMDDVDLTKFVERIKTVHAAVVEDERARAESHVIEAPYASREALLNRLREDLYEDAMALDTKNIANGAVTATQIKASYELLNEKCDGFEYCVLDFIESILELAGIEDTATFTRSAIVNVADDAQVILQSSQYLGSEYVTRKLLDLLGDGDKADQILEEMEKEEMSRMQEMRKFASDEEEDEDEEENEKAEE